MVETLPGKAQDTPKRKPPVVENVPLELDPSAEVQPAPFVPEPAPEPIANPAPSTTSAFSEAELSVIRDRDEKGLITAEQKRTLVIINQERLAKQNTGAFAGTTGEVARDRAEELKTESQQIQAAELQTGAPFAREPSGVPSELSDFGLRTDVARSKGNVDEITLKIRDKYPGAEVVALDEPVLGRKIAVRLPGQERFVMLDSASLATFGDVADAFGSIANIENVATILSALGTQGLGLGGRTALTSLSAMLGSTLDESIEAGRGFQTDPLDDIFFNDVLFAGGAAATGEVATHPVRWGLNAITKRGTLSLSDDIRKAIDVFDEAGVQGPTVGSVAQAFRSMEGQSIATSNKAEAFVIEQTKQALDDLAKLRDAVGEAGDITDEQLDGIVRSAAQVLRGMITTSAHATPEQAGRSLVKARELFVDTFKLHLKRKYDRALAAGEDAGFDLKGTQTLARDLRSGVKGGGKTKETQILNAEGQPLLGPNGKPLTETSQEAVQLRKLDADLNAVVKDILELDPDVRAFQGNTAFEQLKTLRTRLFDLKNATIDGQETIQNRMAGQLWDDLTRTLNEPVGGSESFQVLLRAANTSNRNFERIKEVTDMALIARTTKEVGKLVDIVQPGKAFTLRMMRRIMPKEQFEQFRAGWITKMTLKPGQIGQTLDSFASDPSALRIMLTKEEEVGLRNFGNNIFRMESLVKSAKASKLGADKRAQELIANGDVDGLRNLLQAGGGKNSKLGVQLRRAVFTNIMDGAEQLIKGTKGVSAKAAMGLIDRLDKNGVLEAVLMPDEILALRNRTLMFSLFPPGVDTGGAIQAATLGADVASIASPEVLVNPPGVFKKFFRGVSGFTRNWIVGTVLMSKVGRELIIGAGSRPLDLTTIRVLSMLTAESVADLERREEQSKRPAKKKPAKKKEGK